MLLLYRNSASSRFSRSDIETPGGKLKFGLDTLLYAGLFLLRVGVDTSKKPSSMSWSSCSLLCCFTDGDLNMVCRLNLSFWLLLNVRCIVGACKFFLASPNEYEGFSVSIAEIACDTAMFCGAVWFISCTRYWSWVSSRSASRSYKLQTDDRVWCEDWRWKEGVGVVKYEVGYVTDIVDVSISGCRHKNSNWVLQLSKLGPAISISAVRSWDRDSLVSCWELVEAQG